MATKGKLSERLTMKGQIHKAYKVLVHLISPKYITQDQSIPLHVIKNAKGIAFITVVKAGFVFSGTLGSGIVIAKLPDGTWSGPSSLGVGGMGWGALVGASSTDSVVILNNDLAVKTFSGKGQIKFGGNLSVAVGPIGRDAEVTGNVGDKGIAACYSYSHSRGFFAGLSLQGAILAARDGDNKKFYGRSCSPSEILRGDVKPPENEDLRLLYQCLASIARGDLSRLRVASSDKTDLNEASEYGSDDHARVTAGHHLPSRTYDSSLGPIEATPIGSVQQSQEDRDSPLPSGWRELLTPDGQKYYWHEQRNVTQWERPREPVAPPQPAKPPSMAGQAYNFETQPWPTNSSFSDAGSRQNDQWSNSRTAPPAIPSRSNVNATPAIPPRSYR